MKIKHSGPSVGHLDNRYVNVTGDTMTGDLTMSSSDIHLDDTQKISFDGGNLQILMDSVNFGSGTLLFRGVADGSFTEWANPNTFRLYSNTGVDGLGTWEPYIDMDSSGSVSLINNNQGTAANRIFIVDMTGGVKVKGKLIVDGIADEIQQTIQAHSTQTANIQEWQTSAGVVLASVESNGTLNTQSGRVKNTTRVTTTYTILITDDVIFANTDSTGFTVTLPVGVEGQSLRIINSGSSVNNLIITPNGVEHLIGANSNFTLADGESLIVTYNATDGWY